MSQELRQILDNIRRAVIALMELLDEALGYERLIPSQKERYLLKQIKRLSPSEIQDMYDRYKIKEPK